MTLCKLSNFISLTALMLLLLLLPVRAGANNAQVHGVITQGLITTSDNNFFGPSDDAISLEFTEASIASSKMLSSNLRLAAQILYRKAGNINEKEFNLDFLVLDYQFSSSEDMNIGVRLGRYKNPSGFYNATKDVAFTRPSIFLPQSIYPDGLRDLQLSSDGIMLYQNIFTEDYQWTIEAGYGIPRVDTVPGLSVGYEGTPNNENMGVFRVLAESGASDLRASLSVIGGSIDYDLDLSSVPFLNNTTSGRLATEISMTNVTASLQYQMNDWVFTTELLWQRIDVDVPPLDIFGESVDIAIKTFSDAIYLQVEHYLTPELKVFGRLENYAYDRNDRSGDHYQNSGRGTADDSFIKDVVLGVRWDITQRFMLNSELHIKDGTAWLSKKENENEKLAGHWILFAVSASYRF